MDSFAFRFEPLVPGLFWFRARVIFPTDLPRPDGRWLRSPRLEPTDRSRPLNRLFSSPGSPRGHRVLLG
jgi:hypothetical protein